MTLDDLLKVPYVANGREPEGADCYGLVRLARHHLYGKPWMPLYDGVDGANKRALTNAMSREAINYKPCKPKAGAIACAYRGSACTHIAIVVAVDGKPMVLESDEPGKTNIGPRLTPVRRFESRYVKVVYYDD